MKVRTAESPLAVLLVFVVLILEQYTCSFFFFWFPAVYLQSFQPKTNHCSRRMGPQMDKALAQKIPFKVQVAELELGSTPSRAQYKHLETESSTNSANPLG